MFTLNEIHNYNFNIWRVTKSQLRSLYQSLYFHFFLNQYSSLQVAPFYNFNIKWWSSFPHKMDPSDKNRYHGVQRTCHWASKKVSYWSWHDEQRWQAMQSSVSAPPCVSDRPCISSTSSISEADVELAVLWLYYAPDLSNSANNCQRFHFHSVLSSQNKKSWESRKKMKLWNTFSNYKNLQQNAEQNILKIKIWYQHSLTLW